MPWAAVLVIGSLAAITGIIYTIQEDVLLVVLASDHDGVDAARKVAFEAVQEQFRTGAMSLGWDPTTAQVVIEAYPITDAQAESDAPDDDAEVSEMLLVRMPVGTARAFAKRTREVVGAGRPACPLCGYPIDAEGHVCTPPEV